MRWANLTSSLAIWLTTLGSITASGCLARNHVVDDFRHGLRESCRAVPNDCKSHVHVFLMNGIDPKGCGPLTHLRDHLNEVGFTKTYYGQLYHAWYFEKKIRRIRKEDANAHFIFVGLGLGCPAMHSVANTVQKDGAVVDLLVYLGGNQPFSYLPDQAPKKVGKVLNLLSSTLIVRGGQRDWAENSWLKGVDPNDIPTHQITIQRLTEELNQIAIAIPHRETEILSETTSIDTPPTPRPVKKQVMSKHDDWDFLKPVAQLEPPPDGL